MATSKRRVTITNDQTFFESVMPMKLCHVKKIERHFASSKIPLNHYLKGYTFDGCTARGTTPLILACQHGQLGSVKHIVESWGANVCASAPFYSNPSQQGKPTIQEATPLFVAAFQGYDQIVRYLLEKSAKRLDRS